VADGMEHGQPPKSFSAPKIKVDNNQNMFKTDKNYSYSRANEKEMGTSRKLQVLPAMQVYCQLKPKEVGNSHSNTHTQNHQRK